MGRSRHVLGGPPKTLTGQMPVSADVSPWWDSVLSTLIGPAGLVGTTLTIEELTERVPCYPDGRRPRSRTVARRLSPILQFVSMGPNGARGHGSVVTVRTPEPSPAPSPMAEDSTETLRVDLEFLLESVERMTDDRGGKVDR